MITRRTSGVTAQFARWRRRRQAQWNRTVVPIRALESSAVYVPNPEQRSTMWVRGQRLVLRNAARREVMV